MHTPLCDRLGIEFPIFAFSHCRDVVAAVSRAGGLGVLGAVGFTPEQLEVECNWIDEHVGDKPYGVDIVIPGKYEGMGEVDPEEARRDAARRHPAGAPHVRRSACSPTTACRSSPRASSRVSELLGWTAATANPQVEVALRHPKVKLIANALGTPPPDVIERHPRSGPPGGGALRRRASRHGPTRRRRRHHRRAGHRRRRAHRRHRQRGALARGHRRGGADAGAGGGRYRHRPADRRGARDGRAGRVDRLALADGRRGRRAAGADATPTWPPAAATRCARARSPASRAACCATTGPMPGRHPTIAEAARHAAAVHGHLRRGRARPSLRRQGEGRDVQPGRPDRRADEPGAAGARGRSTGWCRSTSKRSSGCRHWRRPRPELAARHTSTANTSTGASIPRSGTAPTGRR